METEPFWIGVVSIMYSLIAVIMPKKVVTGRRSTKERYQQMRVNIKEPYPGKGQNVNNCLLTRNP